MKSRDKENADTGADVKADWQLDGSTEEMTSRQEGKLPSSLPATNRVPPTGSALGMPPVMKKKLKIKLPLIRQLSVAMSRDSKLPVPWHPGQQLSDDGTTARESQMNPEEARCRKPPILRRPNGEGYHRSFKSVAEIYRVQSLSPRQQLKQEEDTTPSLVGRLREVFENSKLVACCGGGGASTMKNSNRPLRDNFNFTNLQKSIPALPAEKKDLSGKPPKAIIVPSRPPQKTRREEENGPSSRIIKVKLKRKCNSTRSSFSSLPKIHPAPSASPKLNFGEADPTSKLLKFHQALAEAQPQEEIEKVANFHHSLTIQQAEQDIALFAQPLPTKKKPLSSRRADSPMTLQRTPQQWYASPVSRHMITKEQRTRMVDWLVEVCSQFKVSRRVYFLAVRIFDVYLLTSKIMFENSDVHSIGVSCLYAASKYEDSYPLHSTTIANRIAHGTFSANFLKRVEVQILKQFAFQLDFVTPLDFFDVYAHRFSSALEKADQIRQTLQEEKTCLSKLPMWVFHITEVSRKLNTMAMILLKQGLQNEDFLQCPQSQLVLAAFLAAVAKVADGFSMSQGCQLIKFTFEEVAKSLLEEEEAIISKHMERPFKPNAWTKFTHQQLLDGSKAILQRLQWEKTLALSEALLKFSGEFKKWHPGMNQLGKFSKVPF